MRLDEKAIIDFLKCWPNSFVSGKEIARKACGRKRYEEDRGWAVPILAQMVRTGMVEPDYLGYFRLVIGEKKKRKAGQPVSPQILRILKESGKQFDSFKIDQDEDEATGFCIRPLDAGDGTAGKSG